MLILEIALNDNCDVFLHTTIIWTNIEVVDNVILNKRLTRRRILASTQADPSLRFPLKNGLQKARADDLAEQVDQGHGHDDDNDDGCDTAIFETVEAIE